MEKREIPAFLIYDASIDSNILGKFTLKDVSCYFIKNKNMVLAAFIWAIAVVLTLGILNILLGILVHYFAYSQAILWNDFSLYFAASILMIMVVSIAIECYVFRSGGHSLARKLKARSLNYLESTPEEYVALSIVSKLAEKFSIETPAVYVLADEVGVNALTAGFYPKDTVIILTWGALQNLDQQELYGLLSHEFNQILSGETAQNTKIKILYSSLTSFSQLGSKLAKRGFNRNYMQDQHKLSTAFIALGGVIWLFGSLGVLINRMVKYITLSGRTFENDLSTKELIKNNANIQLLLRIYVHHAGSQIHSEFSESISHMCFANSLSPQSWMNIHPSIETRIFELDSSLVQDLQLENLKKIRYLPWFSLFRSLEELSAEYVIPWQSSQPLPLLRLSPISFTLKDAIKPLSPEVRANMSRPELIKRALQTSTGSREVMVAILMIRQYREFIPAEAEVSRSIVDALLNEDGRMHVAIFHEACGNIGSMPASVARQFLTKLAKIIQEDGEIGLLDALLLERVKYEVNLLPPHIPTSLDEVKIHIVRLIDALLHVQQINSESQLEARDKILSRILNPEEVILYEDISDEPIDLAEILQDMSGLLLRERLSILSIAELCLWNDRVITQDELDVLELLYWRLGFETDEIVELMHKKNSLIII